VRSGACGPRCRRQARLCEVPAGRSRAGCTLHLAAADAALWPALWLAAPLSAVACLAAAQVRGGLQGGHLQPGQALLPALRRLHGGRRAPHPALRRHLHVPGRQEEPQGARPAPRLPRRGGTRALLGGSPTPASATTHQACPPLRTTRLCRPPSPPPHTHTQGKLRILYECFPMAMLVEQAGGKATTGTQRSLEMQPDSIHGRHEGCRRVGRGRAGSAGARQGRRVTRCCGQA
jgi:hypothetical protein